MSKFQTILLAVLLSMTTQSVEGFVLGDSRNNSESVGMERERLSNIEEQQFDFALSDAAQAGGVLKGNLDIDRILQKLYGSQSQISMAFKECLAHVGAVRGEYLTKIQRMKDRWRASDEEFKHQLLETDRLAAREEVMAFAEQCYKRTQTVLDEVHDRLIGEVGKDVVSHGERHGSSLGYGDRKWLAAFRFGEIFGHFELEPREPDYGFAVLIKYVNQQGAIMKVGMDWHLARVYGGGAEFFSAYNFKDKAIAHQAQAHAKEMKRRVENFGSLYKPTGLVEGFENQTADLTGQDLATLGRWKSVLTWLTGKAEILEQKSKGEIDSILKHLQAFQNPDLVTLSDAKCARIIEMTEICTKLEHNNIAHFDLVLGAQRNYKLGVAELASRCLKDWEMCRAREIARSRLERKSDLIKSAATAVCKSIDRKFAEAHWSLNLSYYKPPHYHEGAKQEVYSEWLDENRGEWEKEVSLQYRSLVEPLQQSLDSFKPELERSISLEEDQYRETVEKLFKQIDEIEESVIPKLEAYVNAAFEYMALELLRRYDQNDFTGKMSLG